MSIAHITSRDCPIVTTWEGWLKAIGRTKNTNYGKEADLVVKILSLDYCIWMMRRTSGDAVDGGNIDSLIPIRRTLINEYKSTYNNDYNDINLENW